MDSDRQLWKICRGCSRFPKTPKESQQYLPGTPISPLARWHEARGVRQPFQAWIDWDWQLWLEDDYRSGPTSVLEQMKSIWLPSFLTRPPLWPLGVDPCSQVEDTTKHSLGISRRALRSEIFTNFS